MSLIVQKFGGSSVKDAEHVNNVARRVAKAYDNGNDIIVVVSAQGDTTDELIEKAKQINKSPSKREMDVLLTAGEQMSAALLAMALEAMHKPVVSLLGWQAGIHTNRNHGIARIKRIDTERMMNEIGKRNIVIVAGFQGTNRYDDITTLGRGGSDTTAVAIAAAVKAELCQIYTDVDGVYTADPRIVKNAHKLADISYDEMLELASLGANVLHNRSVEVAKKYNVNLEVLSSLKEAPGTIVKEVNGVERMLLRGVTRDLNVARISIIDIEDKPGKAFQIFSLLAGKNINVDVILQSIGRNNMKDISFTVPADMKDLALSVLKDNDGVIKAGRIDCNESIAKVSIVGAGMASNPGVAALMFEALFDADINIHMIATSEIKVSVLVDDKDAENAVRAIHDKFNL